MFIAGDFLLQSCKVASPNLRIDSITLSRVNHAFGVIGFLVGLIFIIGGGYFVHRHHLDQFLGALAKSAVADGTVIENRPVEVHSRTLPYTSYQAIVAFADRGGQSITLADPIAFNPPSFHVGQHVRIFYDPGNPRHAMVDRGRKDFVIPGICLIFGGLTILGSIQRLARPLPVLPGPAHTGE
jgi:hypothetical protein